MNHDFLLKIKLRSHPRLLCVLRGAMEPLMEVLGFSEEECRSIIRAIDESVSNIMRHSYHGRLDRSIEVSCRSLRRRSNGKGGQGVEFLLFDRGPAVDPTKLPGRSLDEVKCGGLGLHRKRSTNAPVRGALSVVKSRNAERGEDNGTSATDASGSRSVGGAVCGQRHAAERILPQSGFELEHAGSPSQEAALEEKEEKQPRGWPVGRGGIGHQAVADRARSELRAGRGVGGRTPP